MRQWWNEPSLTRLGDDFCISEANECEKRFDWDLFVSLRENLHKHFGQRLNAAGQLYSIETVQQK